MFKKIKRNILYLISPEVLSFFRIFATVVAVFLICLIIFFAYLMIGKAPKAEKIEYGVTFSQQFAEQLGLDWKQAYLAILDDLGVKKIRLIAYWTEIEKEKNIFTFEDLDWQIQEAEKRGVEIILAMGRRAPRWPECHIPEWAKKMDQPGQKYRTLLFIYKTVKRYRNNPAIKYWQVENEPFLRGFGDCPKLDKKFIDEEIALVRELDCRSIIMTTSGELSLWSEPAIRTQILGTTLYRVIWNIYLGHFHYPIPPVFYYKRANLVKKLFSVDKVFVAELQAEPWNFRQIYETSVTRQFEAMDVEEFKNTISYFEETGLDEAYLWGAEWWYWLKAMANENGMWLEAGKLFR